MDEELTPIQETVIMLGKVMENYDLMPKEAMKVVLTSYLEMLKEDSGVNKLKLK